MIYNESSSSEEDIYIDSKMINQMAEMPISLPIYKKQNFQHIINLFHQKYAELIKKLADSLTYEPMYPLPKTLITRPVKSQIPKSFIETYNIEEFMKFFNKQLKIIITAYNNILSKIKMNFDIGKDLKLLEHKDIIMDDYNMPVTDELYSFLESCKNTIDVLVNKYNNLPKDLFGIKSFADLNTELRRVLKEKKKK